MSQQKKVLLMGKSGSGKTSMRSIIFANYHARQTQRLGPTFGVENSQVRFLGNLTLNLWDCGGQSAFVEKYFESQRDQIFRNVEVMIYVFDIESDQQQKDMDMFKKCLDHLQQLSTTAHIFCLIHKMDLLQSPEERRKLFSERETELKSIAKPLRLTCFGTSIWDETLYKAWSSIVYSLVPNVTILESMLHKFCGLSQGDEVVLFEKATFLVIANATHKDHSDVHRYEKISNIIKQFKLSCSKNQQGAVFNVMEVKNDNFTAFVESFTTNTYIMVVVSNPRTQSAAVQLNLQVARPLFEKFISAIK